MAIAEQRLQGQARNLTAPSWRRGFASVESTVGDAAAPAPAAVRGRVPEWLRGSLLLNGPAVWDLPNSARWRHWFDGLALLHRVRFEADGVRYHSRFLDSEDARLSRQRGRPELGGYGTPVAGGLWSRIRHMFDPRRTDNGCVVLSRCDGEWLALTESDRVTRFDPDTLATLGEWRWADKLKLPLMAAHPGVDARGQWWNVGIRFGRKCEYVLVGVDRRGQREVKACIPTFRPGYLHAFALSEHHAVIWECAWRAHPLRFLFAVESYADHFDWMPDRGSRLHTVSLADGSVRSWDTKPLFAFHAAQAFERGGDVVLDLCCDEVPLTGQFDIQALRDGSSAPAAREVIRARHTRFVLAPGAASAREETLPGRFDLPQVNATVAARGAARCVWGASTHPEGAFFDRTIKLDHRSGQIIERVCDRGVALEPLFVPRPGATAEDDGVLLVNTLSDGDAGSVIRVLDAATLDEHAAVELPAVVPFGFHGAWHAGR
jgi:carotenoid cleavage dioxygenase-like enzyme